MHDVLHDSHKAEGDDGDIDLRLYGVFRCAPELLDSEVLLEPLEEQFYLPPVLVKFCDQHGRQPEGVGQEHELSSLLLVPVPDQPQSFGVIL